MLDALVGFPTVSRDSNLPLIDFVEDYLASHGITGHRIPNEDGTKAGFVAQVGPNVEGGVVLSGHTDVVPTDGQAWTTDPWTVVEKEGRLYGRGTCDMKGFVALAVNAMVDAKTRDLKRPLQIALSRDEEIGLLGAPDVAQALLDYYPKAGAVIVGEPTNMGVVTGHKGCEGLYVNVRGFEVHSSKYFEGVSAIMYAARLVEWCRKRTEANRDATPTAIAALYDPPFTTLHCGVFNGGTAANITAKDCFFTLDIRCVGDEDPKDYVAELRALADELEVEMRAIHPDTGIDFDFIPGPGVAPEVDGAAEALTRRLTGDNSVRTVSYGTDGGWFQKMGFSTVICGPGSIDQAHQPDEYIEISEFEKGAKMLAKVLDTLEEE